MFKGIVVVLVLVVAGFVVYADIQAKSGTLTGKNLISDDQGKMYLGLGKKGGLLQLKAAGSFEAPQVLLEDLSGNSGRLYVSGGSVYIEQGAPGQLFEGRIRLVDDGAVSIENEEGRIFLTSAGSVGIGTEAPVARLHVDSGAVINGIAIGGDGEGVNYPSEFESIGTLLPDGNLRLQSPNSVFVYAGTPPGEKMVVTGAGNVGIGTSSPGYALDVAGIIAATGSGGLTQLFNPDAATGAIDVNAGNNFQIRAGNVPRVTVLGSGSVGIGTTSPKGKLHLDAVGAGSSLNTIGVVSHADADLVAKSGDDIEFAFINPTTGAIEQRAMVIEASGVGIGTASPTAKLEIAGGPAWTKMNWHKALKLGVADAIQFTGTPTMFGLGASSSGDSMYFFTTAKEDATSDPEYRLVIKNTGNVGIGTTGPTIKLAVGDADTGLNSAGDGLLDIYSNNVNTMSIRSGNVGIGTTSPGAALDVLSDKVKSYPIRALASGTAKTLAGFYEEESGDGTMYVVSKEGKWSSIKSEGTSVIQGDLNVKGDLDVEGKFKGIKYKFSVTAYTNDPTVVKKTIGKVDDYQFCALSYVKHGWADCGNDGAGDIESCEVDIETNDGKKYWVIRADGGDHPNKGGCTIKGIGQITCGAICIPA